LTDKLRYRLLTGVDDRRFCERISAALDDGYELYGSPAATFNSTSRFRPLQRTVVEPQRAAAWAASMIFRVLQTPNGL